MIPSLKDKYKKLVEKIYKSTLSGYIKWTFEPFSEELATSIAGKELLLSEAHNENGEPSMRLTINNHDAGRRESFLDDDMGREAPNVDDYQTYYAMMKAIYDYGVRKATGADADIDDILNDLDFNDDEIPF